VGDVQSTSALGPLKISLWWVKFDYIKLYTCATLEVHFYRQSRPVILSSERVLTIIMYSIVAFSSCLGALELPFVLRFQFVYME
jgi:hypothetical protein